MAGFTAAPVGVSAEMLLQLWKYPQQAGNTLLLQERNGICEDLEPAEQDATHQLGGTVIAAPLKAEAEGCALPHFWPELKKGRKVLTESKHHP